MSNPFLDQETAIGEDVKMWIKAEEVLLFVRKRRNLCSLFMYNSNV